MTQQPPSTVPFLWKLGDTGAAVDDIRERLIALGLLPLPEGAADTLSGTASNPPQPTASRLRSSATSPPSPAAPLSTSDPRRVWGSSGASPPSEAPAIIASSGTRSNAPAATPSSEIGAAAPHTLAAGAAFDRVMEKAVRHFQQQRALTADGMVGPETFRHLDEARWRLGDRLLAHTVSHPTVGDDVAQLQRRLLDMGFALGRVDGVFGSQTERAMREFQRNTGLFPDGTCGPATLTALARLARTVVGGDPHAMRENEHLWRSGPSLAGKVLVLDPGHGGKDPGAQAHGISEADITWDLATRLEGRLAALGVRTYLSRGRNAGGDDVDRARFANATDADLAVSLHTDRHSSPEANGIAAYYYGYDRYGGWSHTGRRFAELAQRELVARCGLGDNRTHGKTWTLLRSTRMPTVRIEVGYLTNDRDARQLASPDFRALVVESIAVALQRLYLAPEDDTPTGMLRLPLSTE